MSPSHAADVVERLGRAMAQSHRTMTASLIAITIRDEVWRERTTRSGEVVRCTSLIDLLCSPPPKGLGQSVTRVRELLRDDEWAWKLFDEATTVKPKLKRRRRARASRA